MSESTTPDPAVPSTFRPRQVSFVRRGGRMTDGQDRAWAELAPFYVIEAPRHLEATSVRPDSNIEPAEVWGRAAPLIVEIGSGQGHAIVHAAASRPESDFLAVEVFRAGLARTMLEAAKAEVRNLRLVEANAPEVLEHLLPSASVSELWVFFPDPWHKSKHNKRRMVTAEFAVTAAAAVRPGGAVRLATDWEDYARQMRVVFDASPDFEREFEEDWAPRFDGRVLTAFERKGARAGRAIRDLVYRRRDAG